MTALYCDRCLIEDTGSFAAPGCECERTTEERQAPPSRDYTRTCGGIMRAAEHLPLDAVREIRRAARAEAVRMVRSQEDLRIEREAAMMLMAKVVRADRHFEPTRYDPPEPIPCLIFQAIPVELLGQGWPIRRAPMAGRARR